MRVKVPLPVNKEVAEKVKERQIKMRREIEVKMIEEESQGKDEEKSDSKSAKTLISYYKWLFKSSRCYIYDIYIYIL